MAHTESSVPDTPSRAAAPSLTRVQHVYSLCLTRVTQKLPRSPAGGRRYAHPIAAELAYRFQQRNQKHREPRDDLSEPALNAWLDDEISAAIVECAQREEDILWLITVDMLSQLVNRALPVRSDEKFGPKAERQEEIRARALEAMEGGCKVLKEWSAGPQAGPFLAYLYRSAENAVVDQLRLKGDRRGFWRNKAQQQDTRGGPEDGAPRAVLADTVDPERHTARAQRAAHRAEAVRLLLDMALAHPGDPDCSNVADYLSWILSDPERERISQAEFARETGKSAGTVGSSLHRFRNRFAHRFPQRDRAHLYTTEGR